MVHGHITDKLASRYLFKNVLGHVAHNSVGLQNAPRVRKRALQVHIPSAGPAERFSTGSEICRCLKSGCFTSCVLADAEKLAASWVDVIRFFGW
jgi:hypothetical protein